MARRVPGLRLLYETRETQTPITFRIWVWQKVLGFNQDAYWPVHFTSIVSHPRNIYCGIETSPGYSPGCYIQAIGKIYIGDYTQIAPNVGIISANHDPYDNRQHFVSQVKIGRYGWIGMIAMILPGVILGDFTVVGAGAVVTKSFEEGYCILAGNPARIISKLEPSKCVEYRSLYEYNGYIKHIRFETFRQKNLLV
jgi:acetyltransferase-like isoleucine patch superfamily enzyme